ncbi:group III truncated hemoglobin [Euryhalocaulis caribicus]|uniref:group III truncated hemoglobin n=1 Tax=Euryhalocaulis caribicus TaxID=1161401 RepID=UPI0003A53583|nr:group III truncated hemoglobin [Euryhalocaulis caribicus]
MTDSEIPVVPARSDRRAPLHPDITEALIQRVVHHFYARVRVDERLGPVFERRIGDHWASHLERMCDFWSSVLCMTGRYKGRPMPAHMKLKETRPDDFERWLTLFRETAREECAPDVAALFIDRAERIAGSLRLAVFFDPARTAPSENSRV